MWNLSSDEAILIFNGDNANQEMFFKVGFSPLKNLERLRRFFSKDNDIGLVTKKSSKETQPLCKNHNCLTLPFSTIHQR